MLKGDLIGEDVAVVRGELQFVVVSKPVIERALSDLADRRKGLGFFRGDAEPGG